jgi:hypothetical protein
MHCQLNQHNSISFALDFGLVLETPRKIRAINVPDRQGAATPNNQCLWQLAPLKPAVKSFDSVNLEG